MMLKEGQKSFLSAENFKAFIFKNLEDSEKINLHRTTEVSIFK